MLEYIISAFFILWFLISFTYIFYKKRLGGLAKFLHRYGWLNEWSMYKNYALPHDKLTIHYRDLNSKDDTTNWKQLELKKTFRLKLLLNTSLRINLFIQKCSQKIKKEAELHKKNEFRPPIFNYLIAVVKQLPHTPVYRFRQIKVDHENTKGEISEIIKSDLIPLK